MKQSNPPDQLNSKPLVSIILAAYNESALLEKNVNEIYNYIQTAGSLYNWEIILVNDGSTDDTGNIADKLVTSIPILSVFHHCVNLNLGNALITGFLHSNGKYIITFDIDLSYSVDHIEKLLNTIVTTRADLVLASVYMEGGKISNVPFLRKIMSKWVNWLMSLSSQEKYHTFTCMVRAYRGSFIRTLNLKARDYEIFPEIIYKAMILRARIIEIPAHLDWSFQLEIGEKRVSGISIAKCVFHGLMASFMFRPYVYFLAGGIFMLIIFLTVLALIEYLHSIPHIFLIAGFIFVIALQLLIQGFSSLQSKRYFEEIFHINTRLLKKMNQDLLD